MSGWILVSLCFLVASVILMFLTGLLNLLSLFYSWRIRRLERE